MKDHQNYTIKFKSLRIMLDILKHNTEDKKYYTELPCYEYKLVMKPSKNRRGGRRKRKRKDNGTINNNNDVNKNKSNNKPSNFYSKSLLNMNKSQSTISSNCEDMIKFGSKPSKHIEISCLGNACTMLSQHKTGISLGFQTSKHVDKPSIGHEHTMKNMSESSMSLDSQPSNLVTKQSFVQQPSLPCQTIMLLKNKIGNSHCSQPCNHVDIITPCKLRVKSPTTETSISLCIPTSNHVDNQSLGCQNIMLSKNETKMSLYSEHCNIVENIE